jgi:hypothetical protein
MEAVIADGPGQSQAIGLTQTPHADANQVMKEMKVRLTISILMIQTQRMIPTRMASHLAALAPTIPMTIAMEAANAIGLGQHLAVGLTQTPHADASRALAIPPIPLTTRTHQTTQAPTAGPLEVLAPV